MMDIKIFDEPYLHIFLLLSWLSVSIIVAFAAIWFEYRNRGGWGWLCLCGALSLLWLSVYFIYPALVRHGLGDNVKSLQDELMLAKETLNWERDAKLASQRRVVTAEGSLKAKEEKEQELSSRIVALETLIGSTRRQLAAETNRASTLATELGDKAKQLVEIQGAHSHLQALFRQADLDRSSLQKELDIARREPRKTQERAGDRISALLGSLQSTRFSIVLLQTGELVKGKVGRYFGVTFTRPNGANFEFSSGKFVLEEGDDLISAISEFNQKVLEPLRNTDTLQIYIRGRADTLPMRGNAGANAQKFRHLNIRRKVAQDLYAAELSELYVMAKFDNSDLPNLRAAFFNSSIQNTVGSNRSEMLEGIIVGDGTPNSRSVDVFLYVRSPG